MAKEISSWKQKSEYKIVAPENFNSRELGSTFGSEPKNLVGRRIGVSLKDLTDDRTKQYLKVYLEVEKVEDGKAVTKFKIFEVDKGYMHSRVRKGMSKVDYIGNLVLSDGKARIKISAVTQRKTQSSQKREILVRIIKTVENYKAGSVNDLVQATLFGKLGTEIYHNVKGIVPINRVEVEELKVF